MLNKTAKKNFVNMFVLLDILWKFQEITLCNQNRHFCICICFMNTNISVQP